MDFALTPEQQKLIAEAASFARAELVGAASVDGGLPHHETLWKACAAQRLTGLVLPVAFGGLLHGHDSGSGTGDETRRSTRIAHHHQPATGADFLKNPDYLTRG